jgi:hypothetical protein
VKDFLGANLPPHLPPKVAAHSREVLESPLTSARKTAQDIPALLPSDAWGDLDSRNSQVVCHWEFSQSNGTIHLSTFDLTKTFNIQDHHVSSIRHKARLN